MLKDAPTPIPLAEIGRGASGGRWAGGSGTLSPTPPASQAEAAGGSRDGGADRSGALMPYGNNAKQLPFLPGKG